MRITLAILLAALTMVSTSAPRAHAADAKQTVYVNLADSLQGSLDELTGALRTRFTEEGWTVVAVHDAGTDKAACPYRARVLVLDDPAFTRSVLAGGPRAAFAVPQRVLLYEDEAGTHLATVNPLSITRTIAGGPGVEDASLRLLRDLTRIAQSAVRGRFVARPYGQVRDRGLIGRTMGVMAGGPFDEKVKSVWSAPSATNKDLPGVAARVWDGLQRGAAKGKWQIRGVYRLDLTEQGVIVIGVSGAAMETKSFAIVGAGGDEKRARYRCAGLAHAAAYPIEIVIYREQGTVHVAVVDGMYRMKMYFEDAGKMKFAANMGMPGSIEDEIRGLILSGLGLKP